MDCMKRAALDAEFLPFMAALAREALSSATVTLFMDVGDGESVLCYVLKQHLT